MFIRRVGDHINATLTVMILVSLTILGGCDDDSEARDESRDQSTSSPTTDTEMSRESDQDTYGDAERSDDDRADAHMMSEVEPDQNDMGVVSSTDAAMPERDDMMVMAPRENLLIDPSFEDGAPAWGIWGGAARVESEAYEGRWALRATNGNGAEQRIIGLTPGATYRLSGWGKNQSDEPMLIGVKDYGGEQVTLSFTTSEYSADTLTFTMGARNSEAVVFTYKHRDDRPGYADAVSLTLESDPVDPPDPRADLELVWSDEFDGSGPLDTSKWGFEEGFARNRELQWYQAENAFREEGMLVIEGRREDRPNPTYEAGSGDWRTQRETIEYTSASVITADRFDWRYGRLEVRAKVTNFTGTWPAIWTLGVMCEWPSSGEVDVMENYGGDILANFAWGTDQRWNAQWDSSYHPVSQMGAGWTDNFHLWALDWTEDQMTITLDGVVLNTIDLNTTSNGSASCAGQNPFRQNHYLLLNLALGGAGGPVDQLSFPTRYLVDYVRVYQ